MGDIKAISLFSSAWIWEFFLKNIGINIVLANEIIEKRCDLYKFFYKKANIVCWDISNKETKKRILNNIDKDTKLLIATPPCQWLSSLWKNKSQEHYEIDQRNFLIFHVFEIIDNSNFDYILIENVPKFLDMFFPYDWKYLTLEEILKIKYSSKYEIKIDILDSADYGVPQTRKRAIIRIFKKWLAWDLPKKEEVLTLEEAIGDLPSLESGEESNIKFHYAKKINPRYIESLIHTPTGKSALQNKIHYPKKENWDRIKWFHNTFKRMEWWKPAPTRTTFCGNVNSHNNVHPWRKSKDWTYSDARPLSLLENLIVSSMPTSIEFPVWISENFINTVIWEWIPPLMLKKIILPITKN